MEYIYCAIAAVVGIIIGALIGYLIRRSIAEKEIGSAEAEADRIRRGKTRRGGQQEGSAGRGKGRSNPRKERGRPRA